MTGEGCGDLRRTLDDTLSAQRREISLRLPWADGKTLSWLYKKGEVISRTDGEDSVELTVRLDPSDADRLERQRIGD